MPRILTQNDVADFRNRLCDIATDLYIELGHDGFNMRELARRLGVSAMTPYRYFTDKDEILAALRARAFDRLADRLEAESGSIITVARAYLDFALQDQASYRLMFDLAQPNLLAVSELAPAERRARAAMDAATRLLAENGEDDTQPLGQVLWSALHGMAALYLAGKLSRAALDAAASSMVNVLAGPSHRSWTYVPPEAQSYGLSAAE